MATVQQQRMTYSNQIYGLGSQQILLQTLFSASFICFAMKSSTCLCRPSVKVRTCEKKRSYLDSFYFLAEGGRAKIFKVDFCQMLILINYFMLEKILFSYSKIQIIHSSFAAAAPSGLLLLPLVWLCFCDFSGDYLSYLLLLLSLRGSYSLFKN